MRKSEACRLDDDHVDLDTATLVVLDSKFGKSRRLFLHASTVAALRSYGNTVTVVPAPQRAEFFVGTRGTRLDVHNLSAPSPAWSIWPGSPSRRGGAGPGCTICGMVRRRDPGRLLPRRRRCSDRAAGAVDLAGHVDRSRPTGICRRSRELLTLAAHRLEPADGQRS